jgi:hypothetical protein
MEFVSIKGAGVTGSVLAAMAGAALVGASVWEEGVFPFEHP